MKRVEAQAKQAKKLLDSIQYNLDTKTYDTKLNVLQSRLDSYAPIGDKYKNAVAAIGDTKNKIEQLNTAMKQQGETAQRAETVKVAYENLTQSIRLAENEMRNLSASQDKVVSPLSLARTNKSFTEYWNKNTKALKKYREQYEAFSTQLANVKTDAEHKKFQLDFADLQTEIVRNGDTGMSITDQLKNSFNRILQFAGIYKIQTYALTMANHTILRFESGQIKIIHT